MSKALFAAAMVTLALAGSQAQAQDSRTYPWCAEYGGGNGGRNCGFQTLAQCRAAISGDNRAVCINTGPRYDEGRAYDRDNSARRYPINR